LPAATILTSYFMDAATLNANIDSYV